MALRFEDLTPAQCRAVIRLTGWASDGEQIGCLESELPAALLEAIVQLERLGLVRLDIGWLGARWWRLTERGRMVRDRGQA